MGDFSCLHFILFMSKYAERIMTETLIINYLNLNAIFRSDILFSLSLSDKQSLSVYYRVSAFKYGLIKVWYGMVCSMV